VIKNKEGNQFKGKGDYPEDYYCYGKPVTACADGIVENVTDDVDDNIIGDPNLKENWGNTVVIRHNDYLYTSVNHLKKGSIVVKKGERVRAGDILGKCGNSGRSPYPHLHFQVQASPFEGSPTISYTIANYIRHQEKEFNLVSYGIPSNDEMVSNIETSSLLKNAFRFVPGRDIVWKNGDGTGERIEWEVQTSTYNYQYIKCRKSGAVAWFKSDDSMFWFTHFTGSKNTLLYLFFLSCYKVPLGYYNGLQISDMMPVNSVFNGPLLWLQDFIAPFHLFLKPEFTLKVPDTELHIDSQEIGLRSTVAKKFYNQRLSLLDFEILIAESGFWFQVITPAHIGQIGILNKRLPVPRQPHL